MKVLIVDDEYLLRQHIIRSIQWDQLGMEVVGEARNTENALKQVAELKPDIVLTDINMPKENGIALAETLRRDYPEICIIIITGYGEFEYAKAAIGAGVFRYLLKPIDVESYTHVLSEAKQEIIRKRTQKQLANAMSNMLWEEQRSHSLMRAMMDGSTEYFSGILEEYGEKLNEAPLMVTVCRAEMRQEKPDGEPNSLVASFAAFCDEIQTTVFFDVPKHVMFRNAQEIICISNTEEACIGNIVERCRLLSSHLTLGNSGTGAGFENLPRLYREAVWALGQKFVLPKDNVFVYRKAEFAKSVAGRIDPNLLLTELRMNDQAKIHEMIQMEFEALKASNVSREVYRAVVWNLMFILNEFALESGGMAFHIDEMVEVIESKQMVNELLSFSLDIFDKTLAEAKNERGIRRNERVQQAKNLIGKRYMEIGLSLNEVAACLFVNAAYLSSLFKRETGVSMMEYINHLRLSKAKDMLVKNPKLSIQEIAHAVGYNNEYYFMRCFKKRYGVSPNQCSKNRVETS